MPEQKFRNHGLRCLFFFHFSILSYLKRQKKNIPEIIITFFYKKIKKEEKGEKKIRKKERKKRKMKGKAKCVLVLGGPGTGKTRYYVAPLLLDFSSCFVIYDAKGLLRASFAPMLEAVGYRVMAADESDEKIDRKEKQAVFISGETPGAEKVIEKLYEKMTEQDGLPVRFVLDDFGSLHRMSFFREAVRKGLQAGVSAYIVIQHLAQFQVLYEDEARDIIGMCSSIVLYNRKADDSERSIPDCFEFTASELARVDSEYAGTLGSIIGRAS